MNSAPNSSASGSGSTNAAAQRATQVWNSMLATATKVFTKREKIWDELQLSSPDSMTVIKNIALPFLVLQAVSMLIKESIIGFDVPYLSSWRAPIVGNTFFHLINVAGGALTLYFGGILGSKMLKSLLAKDVADSRIVTLCSYCMVPGAALSVLAIISLPLASIATIIGGILGLYMFWKGLTPMLGATDNDRAKTFGVLFLSFLACGIVVALITMPLRPTPELVGTRFDPKSMERGLKDLEKFMPPNNQ